MPNNHSKYRIPGGLRAGRRASSGIPGGLRAGRQASLCIPDGLRAGRLVSLDGDHSRPGIHPPASLGGEPLDLHAAAGKKLCDGRGRGRRLDAGEDDLPVRRLQPEAGQRRRALDHVDHIYPVRQGRVEPVPYVGSGADLGEGNLQVLGLTRCPGGRSASVRDLRVRRETSGIGDGQTGPANSPFNSACDVSVTGETHPASLSVPDDQADSARARGRRAWCCRAGGAAHPAAAGPAATAWPGPAAPITVSGSSLAPVGPVWISVPMAGQTPQS